MNNCNKLLSICIPVYNQKDLVRICVEHILQCDSQKIEIVLNDDCSTENIESLLEYFSDNRVKYFRNTTNLGHDRNIIAAFMNASANYCFLLRSRDYIIPDGLYNVLDFLSNNTCAYLTTSAFDSNNVPKLVYKDWTYEKGAEALKAHNTLYVHPSGSIYNKSLLNLQQLDNFLCELKISKYNFTVHTLMRMQLACKGNFVTLKNYSWVYADTENSKDVAMNSGSHKKSVYDTEYELERYKTVILWCDKILEEPYRTNQFLNTFSVFLYASTWNNKLIYGSKQLQKHYNFEYRRVNCRTERKKFVDYSILLEKKIEIIDKNYKTKKRRIILKNQTIEGIKYYYLYMRSHFPFKFTIKKIIFSAMPFLRR